MIDRRNWKDIYEHLEYREVVHQDATRTLQTRESALKMLLLWADDTSLTRAPAIRPSYPDYLARQRRDGEPLSASTQEAFVSMARVFFTWAVAAHPRRYRRITALWLDALRPVRAKTGVKERQAYDADDVRALLAVDDDRLTTRRTKAAVAMLFLSGMRIGAFVTLPIKAVDVDAREIKQWTSLGVKTKFSKSATTFLLDIPDLLEVVRSWDALMRAECDLEEMWYPNIIGVYHKGIDGTTLQSRHRARSVYEGLRELCDAAGLPYLSPHKFRHGHAMHGLAHAKTPEDWRAIQRNLMHSSFSTTADTYGIMEDADVRERIGRLGGARPAMPATLNSAEAILARIQELAGQLAALQSGE